MRGSILVMVLLGGCVAGAEEPQPTITIKTDRTAAPTTIAPDRGEDVQSDVCAAAAALPSDNVCSLICDPPAMADFLVAEGMRAGACYQLRCTLSDTSTVQVGVCLPP